MDRIELTATAALAAMGEGKVSSSELTAAFSERCGRLASLNAFIHFDPAAAKAAAAESDKRRKSGKAGPLEGLPIVLKDNIDTAAMPTTGGTWTSRRGCSSVAPAGTPPGTAWCAWRPAATG
jgi:indoleacetamide hydrolase